MDPAASAPGGAAGGPGLGSHRPASIGRVRGPRGSGSGEPRGRLARAGLSGCSPADRPAGEKAALKGRAGQTKTLSSPLPARSPWRRVHPHPVPWGGRAQDTSVLSGTRPSEPAPLPHAGPWGSSCPPAPQHRKSYRKAGVNERGAG